MALANLEPNTNTPHTLGERCAKRIFFCIKVYGQSMNGSNICFLYWDLPRMHILLRYGNPYFARVNIPHKEQHRVLRGGSYFNHAILCRATRRNRLSPDYQNVVIGFRLLFAAHNAGVRP
ncbi:MAG: SUMF1/EgtB/PvdO family nonheme iron enzyme [Rhodothermia bacterium]|nr:SUMF1/EgtB/PvdO family nonheme iron enzyme [Rhodothermia bacterium]